MIYLDNAATSSPKPPEVGEAMIAHLAESANPGRGGHRMAAAAERMIDQARARVATLIGGDAPERVIFGYNGTDVLNIAIHGVLNRIFADTTAAGQAKRPHVITTMLEHNSVSRPLMTLREAGRIDLDQITCDADGFINPADVFAAIRPETVLVAFTHVSNALGTIQPAEAICRGVRDRSDALLIVDTAQSIGVLPVAFDDLGADMIAFPGHKGVFGPTGTGVLYVGPRAVRDHDGSAEPRMLPLRHGGTGGDSGSPTMPKRLPNYLEAGTPNAVGIAGLLAGIDWVNARGIDAIRDHERALIRRIIDAVEGMDGVDVLGTTDVDRRVGVVSLLFDAMPSGDVAGILDASFDIAVRPGLHCAPYAHRAMGTFPAGAVRVSVGPFTTEHDIDALLSALGQIVGRSVPA